MPITYDTLKVAIKHTLGGDPGPGASYARVINGAGRAWTAAQEWYYLANRTAILTATAGDEWLALPADYESFSELIPQTDGYATLNMVDAAEFHYIVEEGSLGNVASYIGTIEYRTVNGELAPYVRLYPAPSTADTFTLVYGATWADVNEDGDVIPVPKFAEHAFEEWVRLYARGLEEEDAAPLAARMAEFKASPLFMDVARRDALVTGAIVRPGVGAAQGHRGAYVRWNHPTNLG